VAACAVLSEGSLTSECAAAILELGGECGELVQKYTACRGLNGVNNRPRGTCLEGAECSIATLVSCAASAAAFSGCEVVSVGTLTPACALALLAGGNACGQCAAKWLLCHDDLERGGH
jgi:hypothetical protein